MSTRYNIPIYHTYIMAMRDLIRNNFTNKEMCKYVFLDNPALKL